MLSIVQIQRHVRRPERALTKKILIRRLSCLSKYWKKTPEDAAALTLAGDIYAARNEASLSIGYYALAVQAQPANIVYKRQFISAAGSMAFAAHNPLMEKILLLCLETPELECAHAQILWYTLLRTRPDFLRLLTEVFKKGAFDSVADLSPLLQPVFFTGIKRIVAGNVEFEQFMTWLRQFLLRQSTASKRKFPADHELILIEAVAQYCFNTNYIFECTAEEEASITALRVKLENDAAAQQDPMTVGLYACYEPLYKLKMAKHLATQSSLSVIGEVVKAQLNDCLDLQERAAKIPTLTGITDEVSLKVQEQYEEFPYPVWRELQADTGASNANLRRLNQAGLKILVAGCGTGKEPLTIARDCPAAPVLAIDLSRISLAYAAGKAGALGIKNVEFFHADILQLGSLERTFDVIVSMGVLHHMKEPAKGWEILAGRLKPGGIMNIGLYSALARKAIVEAREAIRAGNYPSTAEGIRRFRKDHRAALTGAHDTIFDTRDYYHLNACRDFLFHVQEHQLTLPQIKAILNDLNLAFVEMLVPETVMQYYRQYFPDDPKGKNLDNWNRMEQANTHMFKHMYKFSCRKKV